VTALETRIFGILNVTEDSFSDGGLYLTADRAIEHGRKLAADGADVIDIGAASSHPEARTVSSDEEIARLAPVLEQLLSEGLCVSVDSRNPATQRFCIERGVAFLNDIEGFAAAAMYPVLARTDCRLVVMHSIAPGERAPRMPVPADEIPRRLLAFFDARVRALRDAGVSAGRIILDPGMGLFLGSNPEPSLRVLANLRSLRERLGMPLLISVSRKGFLGKITDRALPERGAATLAAEIWAALEGVDYVRTHDVRALRDALAVLSAIRTA
jgi:dihydropteroate synthase type 2